MHESQLSRALNHPKSATQVDDVDRGDDFIHTRGGDKNHSAMAAWFAPDGGLARAIPDFYPRPSQQQMAQSILNAIEGNETLIVEAGTGTGKTFAYLVPALLNGGKVIISTGTKNLQDQLFVRDLPTIRRALAVPVNVALLKGRANYVCHYHLERAQESGTFSSRQDIVSLRAIVQFSKRSQTGDRAELAEVAETSPVWDRVTSTRDNCLGAECPSYQKCFVMQARRQAQQADVVVVNHHLFFADVMLKDSGLADLLPNANTIIFDEAHQLPEIATLFFGETLSTSQIFELCKDALAEGLTHARDAVVWTNLTAQVEQAARDCRFTLARESHRLAVSALAADHPLFAALDQLKAQLTVLMQALTQQAERSEGLTNCARRAQELLDQLDSWMIDSRPPSATKETSAAKARSPKDTTLDRSSFAQSAPLAGHAHTSDTILWLEAYTSALQLHRTPLSVAPTFGRQLEGAARAWIFTSATLSVKNKFDHYATQLGLDASKSLILSSPFDYAKQALLYVPRGLPLPSDGRYTDAVVDAALPLLEVSRGRAFFLCTTLRAVTRIAERLQQAIQTQGWDIPLLVQGEGSRNALLERFRTLGNAILVGSQSFWEGVDVRGKALSLVVIDKLPFAAPDDPVLAARLDALEKAGQSAFHSYQVPQAAITLKQGAGRLIRAETDQGVLMMADSRMVDKPYGRQLWQSLPPFERTRDQEVARTFLQQCINDTVEHGSLSK